MLLEHLPSLNFENSSTIDNLDGKIKIKIRFLFLITMKLIF